MVLAALLAAPGQVPVPLPARPRAALALAHAHARPELLPVPALLAAAVALPLPQPPAGPAAPPEEPWPPVRVIAAAAHDVLSVPPGRRCQTRYLSLAEVPAAERAEFLQVLSGHLNGFGRRTRLFAPVVVPGTAGRLARIYLDTYGPHLKPVWERLTSPYEHVTIETVTPWAGGVWPQDGQYYAAGTFRVREKQRALAPWLSAGPGGKEALAALVGATETKCPLVNASWFLWQTAVQEGRGRTGYYDFLGVKDRKSFEALVRFDGKLAADLEQRRVVVFSGITQEPRRVERTATVLGGLWRTFDSALAQDKHNPARVLNGDLEFDVTEQIAALPSGMPAFLLADSKGVRQDKAPDSIVAGDRASARDGRLHINLSCIRCHYAGTARVLLDIKAVPIRRLASPDYQKFEQLADLYLRDLAPLLERDRAGFEAAIKAASGGLSPAEYAAAYARAYARYDTARVDLEQAARQFGCPPAVLRRGLVAQEAAGTLDPLASILLAGDAIPIRQFEEIQSALYSATVGGGAAP